jgi:CHAT domain-containing protein
MASLVKGKTKIYLSLDGVFNQINLNTLLDSEGAYLVEQKTFTIVHNTKEIVLIKSRQQKHSFKLAASLFGYPKYFLNKDRVKEKIQDKERGIDWNSLHEEDATGIYELPGTQSEIKKVKSVLEQHQWNARDYTEEEASEEALKSAEHPRVLHIATHGFFVDENEASSGFTIGLAAEHSKQNPLLRSGLLLSGASNFIQDHVRLGNDNGILTAYEAANLNLDNTELVVLSACETGKGEIQNGEGVYGLQRAFQTAGAQAIIMSLWKVDDEATQELMASFYSNWMGGKEKSQAFKLAQLKIKEKYNHPFYWGAFVMMEN